MLINLVRLWLYILYAIEFPLSLFFGLSMVVQVRTLVIALSTPLLPTNAVATTWQASCSRTRHPFFSLHPLSSVMNLCDLSSATYAHGDGKIQRAIKGRAYYFSICLLTFYMQVT